jgi:FtsH-binding integral membrane protein
MASGENEPSRSCCTERATKKGSLYRVRGIAESYVSWRRSILANAKESMRRNPYKRPMIVVLLAGMVFTVIAYLDSVQEHVIYSWPFVFVFATGFCFGLAGMIEVKGNRALNTRISYVYVGLGFTVLGMLYYRVAPSSLNSQAVFGWTLGWLYGMAVIGACLWARDWKRGLLKSPK